MVSCQLSREGFDLFTYVLHENRQEVMQKFGFLSKNHGSKESGEHRLPEGGNGEREKRRYGEGVIYSPVPRFADSGFRVSDAALGEPSAVECPGAWEKVAELKSPWLSLWA